MFMNKLQVAVISIVFFISVSISNAQDFSIYSGNFYEPRLGQQSISFQAYNGTYSLCENEEKSMPILVLNKDNKTDNTYSLDIFGARWASLNANKFSLKKKKSGVVFVKLSPQENTTGKYRIVVSVLSSTGNLRKETSLDVNVEKCLSIDFQLEQEYDKICGGTKREYIGEIINNGAKKIDAVVSLQGPAWVSADATDFSVKPYSKKEFKLDINVPENERGTFDVFVSSIIPSSSIKSEKNFKLDVVSKYDCYKADVISKEKIKNYYTISYIPIKIKNDGIKKAEYNISFEGQNWISIEPSQLALNPGQQGNVNLILNPSSNVSEGAYPIKIDAEYNNIVYSRNIEIVLAKDELKDLKYFFAFYRYYISAALLTLLFIVFVIFKNKIKKSYKNYHVRRTRLKALKKAREARARNRK